MDVLIDFYYICYYFLAISLSKPGLKSFIWDLQTQYDSLESQGYMVCC